MKINKISIFSIITCIVVISSTLLVCSYFYYNYLGLNYEISKLLKNEDARSIDEIHIEMKKLDTLLHRVSYEIQFKRFTEKLEKNASSSALRLGLDWLYYNFNFAQNEQVNPSAVMFSVISKISRNKTELIFDILNNEKQVFRDVFVYNLIIDIENGDNVNCYTEKQLSDIKNDFMSNDNMTSLVNIIRCINATSNQY